MTDFAPRHAIVTASDSGIGAATALALAEAGLDVGITWHSDEEGAQRTAEGGTSPDGELAYLRRRYRDWAEPIPALLATTGDVLRNDLYDRDQVRMRISRAALGSPEQVRVAVRVAGTRTDGSSTGVDWLGGPRGFTDWVSQ